MSLHLGIDLGGTKVVLAVGDDAGEPTASRRLATPQSGDWRADLSVLASEATLLLEEAGIDSPSELTRIGVSVPGPADPIEGVLLNPPNLLGWERVPIAAFLADALGTEIVIENDANAAALAEARFGAGQGVGDQVYLTMSTGVGAGVISNGHLVRGRFGAAGEAGHLPIVPDGARCACGLRGCLEAYVGGNAWRDRLRREAPPDGGAVELAGGDRAALLPEHVVGAALEGDDWARSAVRQWVEHLALGIVPLVMLLEPQRIILGTIAVAAGEELCFGPLRERLADRLWPQQSERIEIVPAALGATMPLRAGLAVAMSASASAEQPTSRSSDPN